MKTYTAADPTCRVIWRHSIPFDAVVQRMVERRIVSNTDRNIAIAIAILDGTSIEILIAILFLKSVLQYFW